MLNRYSVFSVALIFLAFGIAGKRILDQDKLIKRLAAQSSENLMVPGVLLAEMQVAVTQQERDPKGPRYLVSIAVHHNRTFTMPVFFAKGGKWVDLPPFVANTVIGQWIKQQAIGVAAHGTVDKAGHAYLVLPIPETRQ